jgi:hypothetical protein
VVYLIHFLVTQHPNCALHRRLRAGSLFKTRLTAKWSNRREPLAAFLSALHFHAHRFNTHVLASPRKLTKNMEANNTAKRRISFDT